MLNYRLDPKEYLFAENLFRQIHLINLSYRIPLICSLIYQALHWYFDLKDENALIPGVLRKLLESMLEGILEDVDLIETIGQVVLQKSNVALLGLDPRAGEGQTLLDLSLHGA